ncbi:EF-hand domain-containing protein [Desulfovibrio aerotolerans]|uniref:EF-hand domain-containing protein n=1 Tax=Solidesulfovibrio aerotolerans TaxID=295255 RepID=A0A7C9N6N5_9BACT|nr:EF-hand domain-containing protein [Solidesulfovibrio aerotolerans]MYL84475.1 EF-hand domain-containing protein [Solidesulfovibrio aerotolerans]
MKRALLTLIVVLTALVLAAPAQAWKKPPFDSVDKNRDGVIVFDEIVVFNSGLTLELFGEVDVNKDSKIDKAEYTAMGGRRAHMAKAGKTGKGGKVWWRCSSKEGVMLFTKGTDLLLAGKNAEGAAILRQAIATPLCVDYLSFAYYNLGVACMRLGDDACARANLEKARALDVNNVIPDNKFGLQGWPRKPGVLVK